MPAGLGLGALERLCRGSGWRPDVPARRPGAAALPASRFPEDCRPNGPARHTHLCSGSLVSCVQPSLPCLCSGFREIPHELCLNQLEPTVQRLFRPHPFLAFHPDCKQTALRAVCPVAAFLFLGPSVRRRQASCGEDRKVGNPQPGTESSLPCPAQAVSHYPERGQPAYLLRILEAWKVPSSTS